MKTLIGDLVGANTLVCGNAFCHLPGPCSSYTSTLQGYSLQVSFENKTEFLEIPLFGISWTNQTLNTCVVGITRLRATETTLVFGSMFFTQFMSVFENDYSSTQPVQTQVIWPNLNSTTASNITSDVYPQGTNPFPSTMSDSIRWKLIVICVAAVVVLALILVLAYCAYNRSRQAKAEA